MRMTTSILTLALPVLALTACEESTAGPAQEASSAMLSVQGSGGDQEITPDLPGPRGPAEIIELSDELDLSADQKAAIEAIAQELADLNEPLWAQARGGQPGEGPHQGGFQPRVGTDDPVLRQIRENTRAAMEEAFSFLTDEQERLFEELRERPRMGPGAGRPGSPGPLDPGATILGLADELELTGAQVEALEAIFDQGVRGPEARDAVREALSEAQLRALRDILVDRKRVGPGPGTP